MPSKHIDEKTWREIEKITVEAVIATQKPIKQGEILHFTYKKGNGRPNKRRLYGDNKKEKINLA